MDHLPFTLPALQQAYADGLTPARMIDMVFDRIAAVGDPAIFLHLASRDDLHAAAATLGDHDPARPLWGIPFAVKDNIDVAGMPTTAACPAFAYDAQADAFVVARLRAAGAIVIGKTNLDQFATGLVGVRSPYGVPRNAIDPLIVPGGSSSGSAVAVAHGIVSFALGTDTAGSGRVPAALNNIVGLKPSLGVLSATGLVPACRSLDTISVFALTVDDAYAAYQAAAGFDPADSYARAIPAPDLAEVPPGLKIGIPSADTIRFFGDTVQAQSFGASVAALRTSGASVTEVDFAPLYAVADMLYQGAWVAERYAVIEDLLARDPGAVLPVTRQIITKAESLSATDAFRGMYQLKDLIRAAQPQLEKVDLLCVPTMPTFYSLADLQADPITPNSNLGTYTNFVNLMDMCGIAVPTPARPDGRPGGVTLLAPTGQDALIAAAARGLERVGRRTLGATGWTVPPPSGAAKAKDDTIRLAVCGAHMSGLPLNKDLTLRGARFLRKAQTSADYRFYALAGGPPFRPGLVRDPGQGAPIALEIWEMPQAGFGSFMKTIPAPLGIGTLMLADGGTVQGFICEQAGISGARDITEFGDWRAFLTSLQTA